MEIHEQIVEVERRLRIYGTSHHGNKDEVLDELVYIILSNQTEEYSYSKTFESLKELFPRWENVANVPLDLVASAIGKGGLQNKKASFIQNAFRKILADFGTLSLDALKQLDDDHAEKYLSSLPGISSKSARCILMYALDREVFPVDTHVWRVSRRLGWTSPVPKPSKRQQEELEKIIPPPLRYSLHVNMVSHGRQTCTTYWPHCEQCVLRDICPSADKPDYTWMQWRQPKGAWATYEVKKKAR
jgi:endonuclease III